MRVAAVQHTIAWEDPAANFELLGPMISDAAATGAELVLLSEMFNTGFSMAAERIAEPVDGPSALFLHEQAAHHQITIAGSIPTNDHRFELPVNQLVVAGPTGILGRYEKIHPFSFAGEHEHYAPGSDFLTLTIGGVRCTFFVCYDLRFADEFWATAPDTDCYVIVANWPAARRLHWQTLLRARAIENQAWVVAVNRVGTDGNGLAYAGDSMIIDPLGEITASAAEIETLVLGTVAQATVADVRARFPFMNDRRA